MSGSYWLHNCLNIQTSQYIFKCKYFTSTELCIVNWSIGCNAKKSKKNCQEQTNEELTINSCTIFSAEPRQLDELLGFSKKTGSFSMNERTAWKKIEMLWNQLAKRVMKNIFETVINYINSRLCSFWAKPECLGVWGGTSLQLTIESTAQF